MARRIQECARTTFTTETDHGNKQAGYGDEAKLSVALKKVMATGEAKELMKKSGMELAPPVLRRDAAIQP